MIPENQSASLRFVGNAGESLEFAADKDEESEAEVIGHTSEVEESNTSTAGKSGNGFVGATVTNASA